MSEAEDSMMERLRRAKPERKIAPRRPSAADLAIAEARRYQEAEQRKQEILALQHKCAERARTDGRVLAKILRDNGFKPDTLVQMPAYRKVVTVPRTFLGIQSRKKPTKQITVTMPAMDTPVWVVREVEVFKEQRMFDYSWYESEYRGIGLTEDGELVAFRSPERVRDSRTADTFPATDRELQPRSPNGELDDRFHTITELESLGASLLNSLKPKST